MRFKPILPLRLDVLEEDSWLPTLLLLLCDRVRFAILLVAEFCSGELCSWFNRSAASTASDSGKLSFPLGTGGVSEETGELALRAGGDCRVRLPADAWFLLP